MFKTFNFNSKIFRNSKRQNLGTLFILKNLIWLFKLLYKLCFVHQFYPPINYSFQQVVINARLTKNIILNNFFRFYFTLALSLSLSSA